jgi:hypothetical protein
MSVKSPGFGKRMFSGLQVKFFHGFFGVKHVRGN